MKREIVSYLLTYTKGIIESPEECPEVNKAFDANEITSGDIEDAVEKIKTEVLAHFPG